MEELFPRIAASLRPLLALAGALFLCGIPSVFGEPPKAPYSLADQFSVIQTIRLDDGKSSEQRLYRDGDKLRVEVQQGAEELIIVLRMDQKKVYTILPSQKLVLESAYRDGSSSPNLGLPGETGAVWEAQGREAIHGHSCTKYLVKANPKSVYVWLDDAGKYPLRVAPVTGKTVIDWDQYRVGPQPVGLFEPPADFRKMSMPVPEEPR